MIKLLVSLAGVSPDGTGFSHVPGEIVTTLDKEFERRLIESGQAEPAQAKSPRKQKDASNG
jgi:hypothetical protein